MIVFLKIFYHLFKILSTRKLLVNVKLLIVLYSCPFTLLVFPMDRYLLLLLHPLHLVLLLLISLFELRLYLYLSRVNPLVMILSYWCINNFLFNLLVLIFLCNVLKACHLYSFFLFLLINGSVDSRRNG